MKYKFCYRCGQQTDTQLIDSRKRSVCKNCDLIFYENPIPSVCILVHNSQKQILLVKRAVEPGKGLWSLPGGFVETGENTESAAIRELKEETNISTDSLKLLDVQTHINGFYGDITLIAYETNNPTDQTPIPDDDASEAVFFSLDKMPEIAFEIHADFIRKWKEQHG